MTDRHEPYISESARRRVDDMYRSAPGSDQPPPTPIILSAPPEKNGYAKVWHLIVAIVVAFGGFVAFLLNEDRGIVHRDAYNIEQQKLERRLDRLEEWQNTRFDRLEQKIDAMQGRK